VGEGVGEGGWEGGVIVIFVGSWRNKGISLNEIF
jgi:hypothetical protein